MFDVSHAWRHQLLVGRSVGSLHSADQSSQQALPLFKRLFLKSEGRWTATIIPAG
jgi:hypothetical protein